MHYLCINKMFLELQKAITVTEMAPSPFYSNTKVHLVDINVFVNVKFNEIPILPIQDIKEKPKCCGQRITKGNNKQNWPLALFFNVYVHLVDINVFTKFENPSLPFQVTTEEPNVAG